MTAQWAEKHAAGARDVRNHCVVVGDAISRDYSVVKSRESGLPAARIKDRFHPVATERTTRRGQLAESNVRRPSVHQVQNWDEATVYIA